MRINTDYHYSFSIEEKLNREYKFTSNISNWIKSNLESLTDDEENYLFNKVNLGYHEESLKTFGGHPVCDVHLGHIEYDDTLVDRTPLKAHSVLVFYFKGSNDAAYLKCCDVHDYLMQEFITNTNFRELDDIVSDTYILDSELMSQPSNKKWGAMGALELVHILI